ncbi:MAG: MarR family transcriptional regulator [Actinophytocola sp.]|nr:MarR family transcriptional regulator [Actinophytocola sp.]
MAAVDETGQLSARERAAWDRFSTAITMLSEHLERRLQAAARMPHAHFAVLATLADAPERTLRMHELACAVRFSRSRLSHAVGRLAAAGWVRRTPCPSDKRGALATLTPVGADALWAATSARDAAVKHALFDALTAEQLDRLDEISEAVVAALNETCDVVHASDTALREPDTCASDGQLG